MICVMIFAFMVTVAFSVDIAYMHLVRSELRSTTDAAAKAIPTPAIAGHGMPGRPAKIRTCMRPNAIADTATPTPLPNFLDNSPSNHSRKCHSSSSELAIDKKIDDGMPNTGKSTFFNRLTGANASIGNWPGITVDLLVAKIKLGLQEVQVVDLPRRS